MEYRLHVSPFYLVDIAISTTCNDDKRCQLPPQCNMPESGVPPGQVSISTFEMICNSILYRVGSALSPASFIVEITHGSEPESTDDTSGMRSHRGCANESYSTRRYDPAKSIRSLERKVRWAYDALAVIVVITSFGRYLAGK